MNLMPNFVTWILVGLLFGRLAARSEVAERRSKVLRNGIIGAILGGLAWSPFFFEATQQPFNTYVFDWLAFNIFSASCGADFLFLALQWAREWRSSSTAS